MFHQPQKALLIDGGDAAVGGGYRRGAARQAVDQRHLAEHPAGLDPLDHGTAQHDVDRAVDDGEHEGSGIAVAENRLAGLELADVGFTA